MRFLYKLLYRVKNMSPYITLLQKTEKRYKLQNSSFLNSKKPIEHNNS